MSALLQRKFCLSVHPSVHPSIHSSYFNVGHDGGAWSLHHQSALLHLQITMPSSQVVKCTPFAEPYSESRPWSTFWPSLWIATSSSPSLCGPYTGPQSDALASSYVWCGCTRWPGAWHHFWGGVRNLYVIYSLAFSSIIFMTMRCRPTRLSWRFLHTRRPDDLVHVGLRHVDSRQ